MGAMTTTRRRYPRISLGQPATVELRVKVDRKSTTLVRVPAAIETISCEGAGLRLDDRTIPVERGANIRVFFASGDHRFELPASVVAVVAARPGEAAPGFSVRFQLALADHATRMAYARWIVELSRTAQVPQAGTP